MSHIDLVNYYRVNFQLVQHHKWSLSEINSLWPWEREVYVGMLAEWLKEENERREEEARKAKYG